MGHAQALARALALVGVSVLLGAVLELAPPLLVQQIVDAHLALGRPRACSGSPCTWVHAVQVMGFLTEYLTATIAQACCAGCGCALRPPADVTPALL